MNEKNKQGLVVMRQKLSLSQQNARLAIDDGAHSTTGMQEGDKLRLLANGPPIQKPAKSRFDESSIKTESEEVSINALIEDEGERKSRRKRRTRWAADNEEKITVPGMSTNVPSKLNPLQQKIYVLQLQVEDCTRRLRTGSYGIPEDPRDRSPSPEPIYDQAGKRLNTREYRWKRKVQNHRHACIIKLLSIHPEYRAPSDYKAPESKLQERIEIPQEQFPQINFVGLLIGPRGLTLKKLERESGARIMIRGKGSVKESKLISGKTYAAFDEPLHALVSAPNDETLKKAVAMVTTIVKTAVENPEGEADLRKLQVMELAKLNGTLREGAFQGMAWLKEEGQTIVNVTVCTTCGGRGHLASDCKMARPGTTHNLRRSGKESVENKLHMDSEYQALMSELGQTTSAPVQMAIPQIGNAVSQMATHSIGGATVQAAIEDKPKPGAPLNDYGYGDDDQKPKLRKEDMVNLDRLGSGMWDNRAMGMTTDYTIGADDKTQYKREEKAMTMGDKPQAKRRKTYGQADPEAQTVGTNGNQGAPYGGAPLAIQAGPSYQQTGRSQFGPTTMGPPVADPSDQNAKRGVGAWSSYQGMSITGRSDSSKEAYGTGGFGAQGYVDYDPRKDPNQQSQHQKAHNSGHVQYKGFPQQQHGGPGQRPPSAGPAGPGQGHFSNRQVKPGLGYQSEHLDQNLKRDRITPRFNNYARQTLAPNMGFVGPTDPTQQRGPNRVNTGYRKPSAVESQKKHFNGGY